MKFNLFIVFMFFNVMSIMGQSKIIVKATKNTMVLNTFSGEITYEYYVDEDDNQILDGIMNFDSELLGILERKKVGFSELNIKGQYSESIKNGNWTIINTKYFLENPKLTKSNVMRLTHQMVGTKNLYDIWFSEGKRNKIWTINTQPIQNGRLGRERKIAEIQFNNDTLTGSFTFDLDINNIGLVNLTGNLNHSGFLDGQLVLQYMIDTMQFTETRIYDDGYLLELNKENSLNNDLIEGYKYWDVQNALVELNNPSGEMLIVKDSICYDLSFNNNYLPGSHMILIQNYGNNIIEKAIGEFLMMDQLFEEVTKNIYGLCTRRFKFEYPFDNIYNMDSLLKGNQELLALIHQIKQRPKFTLRKSQSESLTLIEHQLNRYIDKIGVIDSSLKLIKSDYFVYNNREEYYQQGIPGLKFPDTLNFEFEGNVITHVLEYEDYVDSHSGLLSKLNTIQKNIEMQLSKIDKEIAESLIFYEEQDKIDSLEFVISNLYGIVDSIYKDSYRYRERESNDVPFAYKMYESVNDRMIQPVSEQYLNNSVNFDEAVTLANKLICALSFLKDHRKDFDRIGRLPKIWEDSTFTIYQDNPFDYRKFETKILSGTQSAVIILLGYQANNLLNARSCEMLNEEINQIFLLESRVGYLRRNFNDENVKLLDRSLRRERVPQRISRLLEL